MLFVWGTRVRSVSQGEREMVGNSRKEINRKEMEFIK